MRLIARYVLIYLTTPTLCGHATSILLRIAAVGAGGDAIFTPRAHVRARGYVIGRGVYISARTFSIFQNTHFQTPISAQEGFSSNLIAFSIP